MPDLGSLGQALQHLRFALARSVPQESPALLEHAGASLAKHIVGEADTHVFPVAESIINAASPILAIGGPLIAKDPEKLRKVLDIATVVAAIPAVANLATKAVKATVVYQKLPEPLKGKFVENVVPTMTQHIVSALAPVLMLQASKYISTGGTPVKAKK